jgi:fucose 4-O-acetylase-like acetyltransferase
MKTEISQRYNWIDWAKTIGILLVIMGHGGLVSDEYKQFIYSFHMPLFFIISGYLFKSLPLKDRLKKDMHSLIIPYFIINGILFSVWFLGGYLLKSEYHWSLIPLIQRLGGFMLGLGYNTDFGKPVSTPTWFLVALFFVRIIATCLRKLEKHIFPQICFVFFTILLVWLLDKFSIRLYFSLNSTIMAIFFFYVGIWMRSIQYNTIQYTKYFCLLRVW